jgi:glycosyltransferase involved in cell wall biosynthesis
VRRWRFCAAGFRQKVHYVFFNAWIIWTAIQWHPSWVYASDPFSCPPGLILRWMGFRVLYHEHDSPEERNSENRKTETLKPSAFQRFILWTRKRLGLCADLCVLPNEKRIEMFQRETGRQKPTRCVWNCPLREEAAPGAQKAEGEFIVFYHGSLVPSRLPLKIIDALALLPNGTRFEFAGYETVGHSAYAALLLKAAEERDIRHRVKYLGSIPQRSDLLGACRRAHVGVALMPLRSDDLNQQTMAGASNKPFDFLACGLALLVSQLPDWKELFVDPGYGVACDPDDAASIAEALAWFVEHPEETRLMGESGRGRVLQDWNYETQFEPVLRKLES